MSRARARRRRSQTCCRRSRKRTRSTSSSWPEEAAASKTSSPSATSGSCARSPPARCRSSPRSDTSRTHRSPTWSQTPGRRRQRPRRASSSRTWPTSRPASSDPGPPSQPERAEHSSASAEGSTSPAPTSAARRFSCSNGDAQCSSTPPAASGLCLLAPRSTVVTRSSVAATGSSARAASWPGERTSTSSSARAASARPWRTRAERAHVRGSAARAGDDRPAARERRGEPRRSDHALGARRAALWHLLDEARRGPGSHRGAGAPSRIGQPLSLGIERLDRPFQTGPGVDGKSLNRIPGMAAPEELIRQVPLFADLDKRDVQGLASTMKERDFDAGATIASEGSTGIGFFIIDEGEATVSVQGAEVNTLSHGDYFGEVALIDDGARTATITAKTPLKAYGITSWEFRPLIESNAGLAWKMLQTMAKRLRDAEQRSG